MKSFLLILLFAIPMFSLVVWHFAFLLAVNKRFAKRHEEHDSNWLSG